MNPVVEELRRTSKGQLVYNKEIGGTALEDLLHKCASVPALSSPHNEISPPRLSQSASFGLALHEDSEEDFRVHFNHSVHQYGKDSKDCDCECNHEEKEKLDSFESEVSPDINCGDKLVSYHPQSPQVVHSESLQDRSSQSLSSPNVMKSLSSQIICQESLQIINSKSLQALTGLSPPNLQILSPKSPYVTSPHNPQVLSPKSPQILSPNSPHVTSPKSPQVMKWQGPQAASPQDWSSAEETGYNSVHGPQTVKLESPVKNGLDARKESKLRLNESSIGEEEEGGSLSHENLTVSFTEKLHVVGSLEMGYDNRSKEQIEKKQQEFLWHQTHLDSQQEELICEVEHQHRQDIHLLHDSIEKKQKSRQQEAHEALQKVKESHQHCSLRQDKRLKEVEELKQQLKKEKARREQALEQKLNELRTMAQKIAATKDTLVTTLDQCPHKEHVSEVTEKTKLLVRKLSEQAEVLVANLSRDGPLEEILSKLKHLHEQSQNALDFVNNLTAEAEKKAKAAAEAERQKQQAALAQLPSQVPQVARSPSIAQSGQASVSTQPIAAGEEGALSAVAKEYEHNVRLLSQMDAALDPFVSNLQLKKLRFDLQRAVNTPVNAISPVNSTHLRDKMMRLISLLKGETVEVLGKQVTAQSVPQGIVFCKNLVAKMIARKADEQVSSNHESAFAIAAVAVGLWLEFPDVGELIMAHLHALCPYVLPFYPPRLPNQSSAEYHRSLGYKIEDGAIEQQDKFLRRMSGLVRLYAAIMVTSPPQGQNHPHPHGLKHAWVWLTRSMNLQPNPDITATTIYDLLQVTGNFLLRAYRVQFVKLLYFLFKVFLPKLKDVAAGSGPVTRLESFLDTTMRNNAMIPEPEGYLSPRFLQF